MRLIDADALAESLAFKAQELKKKIPDMRGQAVDYYSGIKTGFVNAAIVADSFPTIDAVPVGAYEQTRWERDTAIEQLAEIGKSLCEKMDNVATVVRCKDCISFDKEGICQLHEINRSVDDYCSDGKVEDERTD